VSHRDGPFLGTLTEGAPHAPGPMLQELHALPSGLLESESRDLERLLGAILDSGAGLYDRPDILEALGIAAALEVLQCGEEHGLRRVLGVRDAAAGTAAPKTPERDMMEQVVAIMGRRGVFASLDMHNNTGLNPHYACVNRLDNRYLQLAALFSRTLVHFVRPCGVQSIAMAALAPAVTLECGKVSDRHGVDHARDYLDACLHLSELPDHPVARGDIDLFHTVAQVTIPADVSFGFPPAEADLLLNPTLERLNFRALAPGTALGRVPSANGLPLDVRDEAGRDVTGHYFEVSDGELRLKLGVTPAMLTRNEAVIRQDCLCYLMEPYCDRIPLRGE